MKKWTRYPNSLPMDTPVKVTAPLYWHEHYDYMNSQLVCKKKRETVSHVTLDDKSYPASVIIWCMHNPDVCATLDNVRVTHIDGDETNTDISNLLGDYHVSSN